MRSGRPLLLFLAIWGAVAGCATSRREPPSSGHYYPHNGPESAPTVERGQPRLTVAEAIAEGLSYNRTIAQARLTAAIGGTREREARSALLPSVGASAGYRRVDEPSRVASPDLGTTFQTGPRDLKSLAISMDFPIFGFGRHLNNYRAAKLSRRKSEADRDTSESDIAAGITAAAFDLLEGIRAVDVALKNEEAFDQQVQDSQALLDAGRVTREAVLEAQVERDQARRVREKLESNIPILRMVLNGLLGRAADAPTEIVDEPVTRAPVWELAPLEQEALIRRSELRAARLQIEAGERAAQAAWGRELPELRGDVTWETDDSAFRNPSDAATLRLTLDIPIFTGGGRSARIQRARNELDIARLQFYDLETQIRTEVAQAHREVVERFKDIEVAQLAVERTEESVRIQREKFRNGRATSRAVLESTALLQQARFAYLTSLYDYNVALHQLRRARGADPRVSPFDAAGQGEQK